MSRHPAPGSRRARTGCRSAPSGRKASHTAASSGTFETVPVTVKHFATLEWSAIGSTTTFPSALRRTVCAARSRGGAGGRLSPLTTPQANAAAAPRPAPTAITLRIRLCSEPSPVRTSGSASTTSDATSTRSPAIASGGQTAGSGRPPGGASPPSSASDDPSPSAGLCRPDREPAGASHAKVHNLCQ